MITTLVAVGSLEIKKSAFLGTRAIVYYLSTTICAVIIGIVLVISIKPGSRNTSDLPDEPSSRNVTTADTLMDLIRNVVPPNLIEACIMQTSTVIVYPGNDTIPKEEWPFESTMGGSMNILGIEFLSR